MNINQCENAQWRGRALLLKWRFPFFRLWQLWWAIVYLNQAHDTNHQFTRQKSVQLVTNRYADERVKWVLNTQTGFLHITKVHSYLTARIERSLPKNRSDCRIGFITVFGIYRMGTMMRCPIPIWDSRCRGYMNVRVCVCEVCVYGYVFDANDTSPQ